MITLTINGKRSQFKERLSVEEILEKLNLQNNFGVAVALNYSVVPRSEFATTKIDEGDVLDVIHATAGG